MELPALAGIHSQVNVWTGHNDADDNNSRRMWPKLTADSGRNGRGSGRRTQDTGRPGPTARGREEN